MEGGGGGLAVGGWLVCRSVVRLAGQLLFTGLCFVSVFFPYEILQVF